MANNIPNYIINEKKSVTLKNLFPTYNFLLLLQLTIWHDQIMHQYGEQIVNNKLPYCTILTPLRHLLHL